MDRPPLERCDLIPRTGPNRPICCPYQTKESDIPIIVYDIKNDGSCHLRFMDVQNRRLSRVVAIATLLYSETPVTPRRNMGNPPPLNEVGKKQKEYQIGGVSFHILRLKNSLAPQDRGKLLDFLIDDQSQYCLGFRRGTTDGVNEVWEGWFRANGGFTWPSFLPAQALKISGDHKIKVSVGGSDTLNDIFRGLWGFPDDNNEHDTTQLERAFLRAVVVFCETLRLLSIYLEVFNRIRLDSIATPLSALMWLRIRNWSSSCKFVLKAAGEDHGYVDEETFYDRYHDTLGYESFEAIVTELRVMNWQQSLLKHQKGETRKMLNQKYPGKEIPNPTFDPTVVIE